MDSRIAVIINENIWSYDKIKELDNVASQVSDAAFVEFSKKIINTPSRIVGIRVPDLHAMSKVIAKGKGAREFISAGYNGSFEMTTLRGLVIVRLKISDDERINYLREFVNDIDNWATCDIVAGANKVSGDVYRQFFNQLMQSDREWSVRFGIVSLMNNCMRGETVREVIRDILSVDLHTYYIDMAIAWAVSVAYVRGGSAVLEEVKKANVSDFIIRKSISKINDSRRVSKEDKIRVKEYLCSYK